MGTKEYRTLHAEWYELASAQIDHSKEIDFWVRSIEASSEPVLELGSGTGRVLVPLLERGFDIAGIDTSKDMMARCRAACQAKGLKAELYEQSMIEFDLPRKFGLVILDSGGLGLFVSDQDIHSAFERVMAHLKPGGLFIYEFQPAPAKAVEKLPQAALVQADLLSDWPTELDHRFDRIVSSYVLHEFDLSTKMKLLQKLTGRHLAAKGRIVVGDIAFPTSAARDQARRKWADLWDEEEYYWAADEVADICESAGLQVTYKQISSCGGVFIVEPVGSG